MLTPSQLNPRVFAQTPLGSGGEELQIDGGFSSSSDARHSTGVSNLNVCIPRKYRQSPQLII